jgi:hypothetical protein
VTVYSIKIALRGISPMIWRRLRLLGSTSIADRFTYCYNFYDHWLFGIRIEHIQLNNESTTPFYTGGQGRLVNNTPCYRSDEALALIGVLDTICNGDEATTTVGDVRELIEVYEVKRFDRSAINIFFKQTLGELA